MEEELQQYAEQHQLGIKLNRNIILEQKVAQESWSNVNSQTQPYIEHLEQSLALQEHMNGLHKQVLSRLLDNLDPSLSRVVEEFVRANADLIVLGDEHPFKVDDTSALAAAGETLEEWKSKFEEEKSKRIHKSMQQGTLHAAAEDANFEFEKALERIILKMRYMSVPTRIRAMHLMTSQGTGLKLQEQVEEDKIPANPYLSDSVKYLRPQSAHEKRNMGQSAQHEKQSPRSGHNSSGFKGFGDSGTDFSGIKTKLRIIKAKNLNSDD